MENHHGTKANLPLVKAQLANIRPQQKDVLGAESSGDRRELAKSEI